MLKLENCSVKDGRCDANNNWAPICDACRSAAPAVYCRADLAYLCSGCDTRIHAANQVASRHERVRVCEACEFSPAAFLCKADAASLCAACDSDIHSANPLARRHHRVPIRPIHGIIIDGTPNVGLIMGSTTGGTEELFTQITDETENEEDEDESASWLLLNPVRNYDNDDNGLLLIEDTDDYLCLDDYNSCQNYQVKDHQQHDIVPDQKSKDQVFHSCFQLGLEYNCPPSVSHSVSLSPVDVGIFPESRVTEVPITHSRPLKGTIDLFSSPPIQIPIQLTLMDREARVLRYREKKKSRKFEKTIRYASRKAYAETRPRIQGRFAKRKDIAEIEMDHIFSASLIVETPYGIVPSF